MRALSYRPAVVVLAALAFSASARDVDAQARAARPQVIALIGTVQAARTPTSVDPYVRSRVSQLRFCYAERGLKADSTLFGFVQVAFRADRGARVDSMAFRPISPSWRGPAAGATEQCVRERFRSWRLPSDAAPGTYLVVIGFAADMVPAERPADWGPPPSPDGVLPSDAGVRTPPRGLPLFHVP